MSKTATLRKVEENPSGIEPIEYKVLVRPKQEDGYVQLKSGFKLLKPDETKERDQHATMEGMIVRMSPLAFGYEQWPAGSRKPEVGDAVVFARYSGLNITGKDGVEYRLMNDKDVVAVRT